MKRTTTIIVSLLAILAVAGAATPAVPDFLARHDYIGLISIWCQAADTNGDGIPDLIGGEYGFVEVLFGNGDGTFSPGVSSNIAVSWYQLIAIDLNGDGKADLVGPGNIHGNDAYPNGVGVSLGNGDGTFQAGVFYEVNDSLGYAVAGDFNGDGIPDVAVSGGKGVWLLTGRGGGILNPAVLAAPLSFGSSQMAAADFNRDGKLDLVVSGGDGFSILLGNGDGTFQAPETFSLPTSAGALAAGKLTKDGYAGVAISGNGPSGSGVYVFEGNGRGGFSEPIYVDLPGVSEREGLAIGDVNGDGIGDLVSGGVYVALGTPGGGFQTPVYYQVAYSDDFFNVILADLRNNGQLDIASDSYNAISVLLNTGKGKFDDGQWNPVTGGANCGAAADYNGDGKPDLAVNNAQGISILFGTGIARKPFVSAGSIALANAGCVISGDLNGDGISDLLVPANGTVAAYLGNGDGTFTLKSTTPTPSGGYLALGDFNHDGKLDFATSGNLLALGNGDGTFQTPTAIVSSPPSSGFSNIAAGDINNDGWTDLVLTNSGIGPFYNVYVLLNNQQGGFNQAPTTFGATTGQAVLADLNGDGYLDLVLASAGGDVAGIYLGDGTGAFTFDVNLDSTCCLEFELAADVNGDGIPDIELLGGNTIAVYLGEGGGTYAAPIELGVGAAPADLLVEDLHGQLVWSGLPDIVVPDSSGGVLVLLNLTSLP